MPRRSRRQRRRQARGIPLPPPGASHRYLFTGTINGETTQAVSITTKESGNSYRILKVVFEVIATFNVTATSANAGTSLVQVAVRGEGGTNEIAFSPVRCVGITPIRLMARQPRSNGFWSPTTTTEHAGWIRNIGKGAINYTAIVWVSVKYEHNSFGDAEMITVLPVGEDLNSSFDKLDLS